MNHYLVSIEKPATARPALAEIEALRTSNTLSFGVIVGGEMYAFSANALYAVEDFDGLKFKKNATAKDAYRMADHFRRYAAWMGVENGETLYNLVCFQFVMPKIFTS